MTAKQGYKKTNAFQPAAKFRQIAEDKVKAKRSKKKGTLSDIETYKLIHELEVHQVELEMQQEELTIAKELAETASAKYNQLYDFAPSGYLTLSYTGDILLLNFTAAQLLGNERGSLINKHFATFLSYDSRTVLGNFIEALFESGVTQTTEVQLALQGRPPVYLILTGIANDDNESCNITFTDITERRAAEAEINMINQRKAAILNAIPDQIFEVGIDGVIYDYHTQNYNELLVEPEVFINKNAADFLSAEVFSVCMSAIREADENGLSKGKQYALQLPKGKCWFGLSVVPIPETVNGGKRFICVARDITESKKTIEDIRKLNRIHVFSSQINDLILRSHNREEIFTELCNIAINTGKFRMSWIGLLDEATKLVKPVAVAGFDNGYLKSIKKITIANLPEGRGPAGAALREGRTFFCNDIANDPIMKPWRKEALQRGYHSSISLPIKVMGKAIAAFILYAGEPNFFSEEEVALLEKVTENISFCLQAIITEQKSKKSEQKLAMLYQAIEQSQVSVVITDTDANIEYVNKKFTELSGYSADEVIGKNPRILQSGEKPREEYKQLWQKILLGEKWHGEFHNRKKNGELYWESANISPVFNEAGVITNYIALKEDITLLRQTNEAKRAAQNRYSLLVENSPYCIHEIDLWGNICYMNVAGLLMLGIKQEQDIVGVSYLNCVGEDDKRRISALLQEAIEGQSSFFEFRSGDGKYYKSSLVPLSDQTGKTEIIMGISIDITDRRIHENELKEYAAKLESSNSELENFAYIASHDLQEPLRMVTSFLSLLVKRTGDQLDETSKKYLDFAMGGATHMKSLINDLLTYSRTTSNKDAFEKVNLAEVLQYDLLLLKNKIKDAGAVITVKQLPVVLGNKILLGQLFLNLLDNAIKYGNGAVMEIEVGVIEDGAGHTFYVSDKGMGIDPRFHEKIFTIFQRLVSKDQYPGTGIGLTVCKKIAEIHNGRIWVESELKKGSTFYFSIPKQNMLNE